jgi:serine/threonine protein kinase
MGEVYRARDLKLGRPVALKVLHGKRTASEAALSRFEQEARATSALNHPHIVQLFDFDTATAEGTKLHYLAMELVEGIPFRKVLNGRVAITEILEILAQVADALDKAHDHGIVHRDVKPENVIVTRDGYAKVLDFGIAKLMDREVPSVEPSAGNTGESQVETQPGEIMGTLAYMAPEQIRGSPVDRRTDVFALGALLFEAAMGVAPFRGDRASTTLHAILHSPTPEIRRPPRPVPPAYDRIVRRCLEKDPDARYQSCREVSTELRSMRRKLIGSPTTRALAWARSYPVKAAALAALVLAIAAACAVLLAS